MADELITPEWVERQIARIDCRDGESAHEQEDYIYSSIIAAIAAGNIENPGECARLALKTKQLDFKRWCA
ncbi:MAG: hypothetical protein AB1489_38120 [Acidobacteriota bacterium]